MLPSWVLDVINVIANFGQIYSFTAPGTLGELALGTPRQGHHCPIFCYTLFICNNNVKVTALAKER